MLFIMVKFSIEDYLCNIKDSKVVKEAFTLLIIPQCKNE